MDLKMKVECHIIYDSGDDYTPDEQEAHDSFVEEYTKLLDKYELKECTTIFLRCSGVPISESLMLKF